MFDADFEYWLEQDIEDIPQRESIQVMVERLQSFRNDEIEGNYTERTEESLHLDPEGEFSGLGVPTIRLNLESDSGLMEKLRKDAEALRYDDNGAVMQAYNAGRGVKRGIQNVAEQLENMDLDQDYSLEVLNGDSVSPVAQEDIGREAVKHVKDEVLEMDEQAGEAMAVGLLAAYVEDDYI